MPKKKAHGTSDDQDLDGFDNAAEPQRHLKRDNKSTGSRSSGGGSRKSKDKRGSRSSMQDSKIGSSIIEKMGGHAAARRQIVTELLYHCSVGSLNEAQKLVKKWGISLSDPTTSDYDMRTPLHLAAAEGSFSVAKWLLDSGASHSPIDRFKRTPLEEAMRGSHRELISLLLEHGALVIGSDGTLGDMSKSTFSRGGITSGTDPDWMIEPGSIMRPGPVQLVKRISEGENGSTFKGMWRNTVVAVKVLNESESINFGDLTTELDLMFKVHHPHVLQLFGAVVKQKPYMIISEYMTGGSVYDILKEGGHFSFWRSLMLGLDFARAMDHLHSRPQAIIHGDLRPSSLLLGGPKAFNPFHKTLLVDEVGILKVAEYGLAKALKKRSKRHAQEDTTIRAMSKRRDGRGADFDPIDTNDSDDAGAGLGFTNGAQYHLSGEEGPYRYMAPEVFRNEPFTGKADVFSFGMICYHLYEGLPPFANLDPFDAAKSLSEDKRPFWGMQNYFGLQVPIRMKALVESCWAADPEVRPEFDEIVELLEEMVKKAKPVITDDTHYVGIGKGRRRSSFGGGVVPSCSIS